MKELIRKAIVILVLIMMLINSSLLLIISKAVDAIENAIDESKINPLYEINLEKYVNYNTENDTGTVVQMNLKTGIEYGEGIEYKPLNSTETILNLPKIEEEYPESVEVIGKSTKATNGNDTAKDFEVNYNKDSGEARIFAENRKDDNGNIYSDNVSGARDEYTVILYYGSNCYTDANVERNIDVSGYVQANIANEEGTSKKVDIDNKNKVTENVSGLISTSVRTSDIYNGYISANGQNNTSYTTEYTENIDINISKKEISDEMIVSMSNTLINKSEETVDTDAIIYKSTRIDKNKILDILGQDGYLKVQNENGEVLGELNKDTEVNENGIYEVTYQNEVNKIIVKTSKPVKVGTIQIENTREIKETVTDVNINRIQTNAVISCINNIQETVIEIDKETNEEKEVVKESTKEIYKYEDKNVTEIKDAETRIDMSISNTNWTNNVQNDITFNATLVANSARYNLFKNPVIEIKLPQEVEKVILGEASLVYGEGLTKKEPEVIERDGHKVIRMELEGSQVEYFTNSMIEGANVIIPATIIVRKDIGNVETNVSFTYTNENGNVNDYQVGGAENKAINVNIEAILEEQFMMKAAKATSSEEASPQTQNVDYTDALDVKVEAILGDKVLGDGDTVHEKQIIKYAVSVTNKSQETISGIQVEGQVPEGTVYAELELGGWMEDICEYKKNEEIKTHVLEITEIKSGETATDFYTLVINDLGNGETEKNILNTITTKINNTVYKKNTKNNVIKKAEMEVFLRSYRSRDRRNQFYYYLDITNLTDKEVNNVKIESNQLQKEFKLHEKVTFFGHGSEGPDGKLIPIGEINEDNKYVATIGSMQAGEQKTILMIMDATNFEDNINECEMLMTMYVDSDETDKYISNESVWTAYPEYVTAIQELDKEGQNVSIGEMVEYKYTIKNESKVRTLVNIQDTFSKFLEEVTVKYDYFDIRGWYYIVDENSGKALYVAPETTWYELEIEENLGYELAPQEKNVSEQEPAQYNKLDIPVIIPAGKTLEITVTGIAAEVFETTEIDNYMIVSGETLNKTTSTNISKFTIVKDNNDDDEDNNGDNDKDDDFTYTKDPDLGKDDPEDPNNPDNPYNPDDSSNNSTEGKYNINGIVWVDKNKDGIKQLDEEVLEDVPVKLYNADTNSIVVGTNNNKYITNTNSDGKYEFNNIPNGNYLVLFEYDTEKYEITKYFEYGKNASTSNAMKKQVAIDGVEKTVGVTDIIKINNENIQNINIGLIANRTFDLKLDKYISKVTVKNDKTKTYEYKNKQLAKVEIAAKQIEKTQVEIEYKIVVTNEGNTSAYVDEIVDYLPQDLQFAEEANKGWTKDVRGNFINNSLSGQKINAGESKELTLIVTKKMTSQNTGTVLNSAEINKTKSSENLKDIDSIEGNNNKKEDDYSEASVIISIKTGLVRNIIIFVVSLIVIAVVGILFKKIKNKKMIVLVWLMILITGVNTASKAMNISGGATATGADGNTYQCQEKGKGQCHGGKHEYVLAETTETVTRNEEKVIKNYKMTVKKGSMDSTGGKILITGNSITLSGDGAKFTGSDISKKISVTYIPDQGTDERKRKKLGDDKIKNNNSSKDYKNGISKDGKKYCFDVELPTGAAKIEIEINLEIKDAIEFHKLTTKHYYWVCVSVSGSHGGGCRDGASNVQAMARDETIPQDGKFPKYLNKTIRFNPTYGNIQILKVDKTNHQLIKNDSTGTTKFKIYKVDSDDNKVYVDTIKDNIITKYTSKEEDAHVFKVDDDGIIRIEQIFIDDDEYYLQEVEAKQGYEEIEEDYHLSISNTDVSRRTQLKRAMKYLFTTSNMRSRMYNLCLKDDDTLNTKNYIKFVYNTCRGKSRNSNSKVEGEDLDKVIKYIEEAVDISNKPTKTEIKNIIDCIFNDEYKDGKDIISDNCIDNTIYKNKGNYTDNIKESFGSVAVGNGDIKAIRVYLEETVMNGNPTGNIPFVVENQKSNGWLRILKRDADNTQIPLSGAVFWIYGTSDLGEAISEQHTTNAAGEIKIEIKAGTYTIEEIAAPKDYILEYQLDRIRSNVNVTTSNLETNPCEVTFYNKKYENLRITKVDKDTDQTMEGVEFKVAHSGYWIQILDGNKNNELQIYMVGNVDLNPVYPNPISNNSMLHVQYTADFNSATTFITNSAGEIFISGLDLAQPTGTSNPYYTVKEISMTDKLNRYYEINENNVYTLNVKSTSESSYTRQSAILEMLQDFKQNKFLKQNVFERKFSKEETRAHVKTLVNALCGYDFNKADIEFTSQLTEKQARFVSEVMTGKYIDRYEEKYRSDIERVLNDPDECRNIIRVSNLYSNEEKRELENQYKDYLQPDGQYHVGNKKIYQDILKNLVNTYRSEEREKQRIFRDTTILDFIVEKYESTSTDEEFIKDLFENAKRRYSYQYNEIIRNQYKEAIDKVVEQCKKSGNYEDKEKINEFYDEIKKILNNQYPKEMRFETQTNSETKEKILKIIVLEAQEHCEFEFEVKFEQSENKEEIATQEVKNEIKDIIERRANSYKSRIDEVDRIQDNTEEAIKGKDKQKKYEYVGMIRGIENGLNSLENYRSRNVSVKDATIDGTIKLNNERIDIDRANNLLRDDYISFNDIGECEISIRLEIEYEETVNSAQSGSLQLGSNRLETAEKIVTKTRELTITYQINKNGKFSEIYEDKYGKMSYNRFIYDILSLKLDDKEYMITSLFNVYLERSAKQSEIKYYKLLMEGKPTLRIENEQKWIDMSGYVWEDNERNKNGTTSASDGKYDSASENKVANILVSLKDSNGAIVLDKNGNPCSTVTDSRGNYKFENIPLIRDERGQITNLSAYHMEFQYDGFTYTSVILANLDGSNTSKAAEVPDNRTSLNNKFAQVTQGGAIGNDGNKLTLNYDKTESKYANYINEAWKYNDGGNLVITAYKQNGHNEYDMLATTTDAGYVIKQGQGDRQYEITDINLGVKAREMPNALIYNHDVDNVKVTINGHTNVYKYDQNMVPANLSNLEYGQLVANVSSYKRWIAPSYIKSIEDLSANNNELKVYVTYKITLKNASNTLKMSINGLLDYYDSKYRNDNISVGNAIQTDRNVDNYYGLINQRKEENGIVVNQLSANTGEGESYGYKAAYLQGVNGPIVELDAGKDTNIYIQYEVKKDAIANMFSREPTMNNIAEIYSFTTYYGQNTETDSAPGRQGQIYAAVDADSEPGNAQIGEDLATLKEQYENDTDISPAITLAVGNERNIEGNVFEDLPKADDGFDKDKVNTDKERIGDGIYTPDGEKNIQNVLVELIPITADGENTPQEDGIAYIYPRTKSEEDKDKYDRQYIRLNSEAEDTEKAKYLASTVTNDKGGYQFIGIIPGHYQVRFKYGEKVVYRNIDIQSEIVDKEDKTKNEKVTVEKHKATIRTAGDNINYNDPYWYQYDNEGDPNNPRYSDALDNYESRESLNEYLSTIDYGKKTAYEKGEIGSSMDSYTNTMDVAIQNIEKAVIDYISEEDGEPTGTIGKIDFGIIERPRQELQVEKIIKNMKITLSNGQVLVEGDPKTMNSQYVTYPDGSDLVKIEVDNEILQGSTLEITYGIRVTNLAEKDYSNREYYEYGIAIEPKLVKQTISKLLDYMDNRLSADYIEYKENTTENWQKLSKDNIVGLYNGGKLLDKDNNNYQKISYDTYKQIKDNGNILIVENSKALEDIKPNEYGEIEVKATKLLSTSNDNLFINNTEIVEEKNSVGRFTFSSTPGNYYSAETEPDGEEEQLTVIPPTGEKSITPYIIIGTMSLLILTGGIILIKKKVLDL